MTKTFYLANLGSEINENDLKESLELYGEIKSIKLNPSEGTAYILFKKQDDANLAMRSMEGIDYLGHLLRVGWAHQKITRKLKKAS